MRRALVPLLATLLITTGCAGLAHKVTTSDIPAPAKHYVTDQTKVDDYPGFMAGEGNVYSCRGGIHLVWAQDYQPAKAEAFAALLAQQLPAITSHQVVLNRFDVYTNRRQRMVEQAYSSVGPGLIADVASNWANRNLLVVSSTDLLLDLDPLTPRLTDDDIVGCSYQGEGEYYWPEITGGHNVVVTWLKFDVDGKPYLFRTFFHYEPTPRISTDAAVNRAVRETFKAIAPRIDLQSPR